MNLFGCCLLFGLASVFSEKVVSVCKYVSSSKSYKNGVDTNKKKSFILYKGIQNSREIVGQKRDKGNNGSKGAKGTKGNTGEANMTEIYELKLQLELGEFHGMSFQ